LAIQQNPNNMTGLAASLPEKSGQAIRQAKAQHPGEAGIEPFS